LDAKFFLQIFSNYSENFMFQTFSYQFFSFSPLKIFFFENLLSQNNKKLLKKEKKKLVGNRPEIRIPRRRLASETKLCGNVGGC